MSITKIAKAGMEVTADYQKLSDLNVAFYNQDINTSILQFNVTRNDAVVPLGKTNVEGYIVLLHEDGSRIQDNLVIENEEHGVIQYTIPREFLKHTGKVLGQVYIAVKGRDDTAVMRKISFDIKQDLMTAFSSIKKLEYIKTFDDLQTQIKQRVEAIEEAIANGEDYVAQMVETLDTGKKEIAATVSKATTDVNKAATDATKKIVDTSNTAVATVNAKGDAVLKAFTENGQVPKITADNGAPRYDLNSSKDLFAEIITWGNGFFTFYLSAGATNNPTGTTSWLRGTVSTYGNNSNVLAYDKDGTMYTAVCANGVWRTWGKTQSFKITNDDGTSLTLDKYDLLNTTDVTNFDGYVTSASNSPTIVSTGYFKRKYRTGYIEVSFSPYNANVVYRNAYHFGTKVWFGWEKIISQSDTSTYQKQKITNDDGSTIAIINYDLLNTTDVSNFDGYSNTVINMPNGVSQAGYIKRKYRGGYIEITYSPYNINATYRNSYNSATKVWYGWEKIVYQSDTATYQKQKIWNDDGTTIVVNDYDLLNTTDVSNLDAYIIGALNMPTGVSPSGYVKRKYRGGYIEVNYVPYSTNTSYRNLYNSANKVWSGWVQSANQADVTALKGSDTGWITYNTVNGVLANTSFTDPTENGYKCAYRKITANGVTRLLLRVNISNITAESVIFANLPNGIVINAQSGVARTNKANQKVVVVLRPNGELSINVPTGFSANSYSYHQFDWTF